MSEMVNLTPHAITFVNAEGKVIRALPSSGIVARIKTEMVMTGVFDDIPITSSVYGEITDLPARKEGTIYVVSSLVAQRCPEREDVFIPNESVRDSEGRIIGCKSLAHV